MKQLYIVGIGPGNADGMTAAAREALSGCTLLCGYTEYIRLVSPWFPRARALATPMKKELERCRMALEQAAGGETVGMVCSGDAGVYGMAGPILELAPSYLEVEIEVVAGVTAAQSGAAVLGAPLGHDYAVVSLSDLLTPWELILKRLTAAATGDFCICIYNPRSKKRSGHLTKAAEILLQHRDKDTVCGWVRCIGREQRQSGLLPLKELGELEADMFTTVFIGNSATKCVNGRMVTPRGYAGL